MFESARLRLERANKHIVDLETVVCAFLKGSNYTLTTQSDPNDNSFKLHIDIKEEIPSIIGLIIGDAIHNMRTALDHAFWELIGIDQGTQDRYTSFVTGKLKRDYEASCNGIKTPRADTKEFFKRLGVYSNGPQRYLYGLHLLDNADKHTILTPFFCAARVSFVQIVDPSGRVIVEMHDCANDIGADGIMRLGTYRGVAGLRADLGPNPKATLEIFFGKVEIFESKRIIPTLMELSKIVEDCLGQFTIFVQTRS